MSKGVNKVIIVGNIGQDPETKFLPSANAVTNISVATSESWKDKQTGQQQERTEWHRVVFFNRLAEIAGEYLRKGSKVYIEGSLRTRKWQAQDGSDRYSTEIVASEMQMLDSRGDQIGHAQQQAPQQQPPQHRNGHQGSGVPPQMHNPNQQAGVMTHQPPANMPPPQNNGYDQFDNDIPF
jgi:single-strand DNA-binding protein